ncbi:SLC2A4 regulator isoform X1 [Chrysemys picta bellii]|uniref:SLC2A4 regulator isoform X1 n=1 Tax=Chrysemys picta bellii TaxID=8478 RepID=UPI0032B1EAB7
MDPKRLPKRAAPDSRLYSPPPGLTAAGPCCPDCSPPSAAHRHGLYCGVIQACKAPASAASNAVYTVLVEDALLRRRRRRKSSEDAAVANGLEGKSPGKGRAKHLQKSCNGKVLLEEVEPRGLTDTLVLNGRKVDERQGLPAMAHSQLEGSNKEAALRLLTVGLEQRPPLHSAYIPVPRQRAQLRGLEGGSCHVLQLQQQQQQQRGLELGPAERPLHPFHPVAAALHRRGQELPAGPPAGRWHRGDRSDPLPLRRPHSPEEEELHQGDVQVLVEKLWQGSEQLLGDAEAHPNRPPRPQSRPGSERRRGGLLLHGAGRQRGLPDRRAVQPDPCLAHLFGAPGLPCPGGAANPAGAGEARGLCGVFSESFSSNEPVPCPHGPRLSGGPCGKAGLPDCAPPRRRGREAAADPSPDRHRGAPLCAKASHGHQEAPRRGQEVPQGVRDGEPGHVVHSLPVEEGLSEVRRLSVPLPPAPGPAARAPRPLWLHWNRRALESQRQRFLLARFALQVPSSPDPTSWPPGTWPWLAGNCPGLRKKEPLGLQLL